MSSPKQSIEIATKDIPTYQVEEEKVPNRESPLLKKPQEKETSTKLEIAKQGEEESSSEASEKQEVHKNEEHPKDLVIEVTEDSSMRNQLSFAISNVRNGNAIILRGFTVSIPKVIRMADIVKLRISGVHQINDFKNSETDAEGKSEGVCLEITLSRKQLDTSHIGYQKPKSRDFFRSGPKFRQGQGRRDYNNDSRPPNKPRQTQPRKDQREKKPENKVERQAQIEQKPQIPRNSSRFDERASGPRGGQLQNSGHPPRGGNFKQGVPQKRNIERPQRPNERDLRFGGPQRQTRPYYTDIPDMRGLRGGPHVVRGGRGGAIFRGRGGFAPVRGYGKPGYPPHGPPYPERREVAPKLE